MSRYTKAEEEAVRTATRVRDWKDSGLIDAGRSTVIERELQTDFRRTQWALRIVLFLFSAFVIQSALGLVAVVVKPDEEAVVATLALMAGIGSAVLADVLIARFRLYRFGVEEACVVCAVGLVAAGVTLFGSVAGVSGERLVLVAVTTIALTGVAAYWRFGLLYCAVGAAAAAAVAPFFLNVSEMQSRILTAAVLLGTHIVSGVLRRPFDEDYPGDDYGIIESVTWLGIYVALNLELQPDFLGAYSGAAPSLYWATYAAVWLLPIVGLYRGVRQKHHWMIRASLVMALATLATNKLYLGWPRHTWDPILLGVFLMGVALGVRRWLAHGARGQKHGFTSHRLLASDQGAVGHIAMVTALKPGDAIRDTSTPDSFQPGGGGRSGGAGAGGSF